MTATSADSGAAPQGAVVMLAAAELPGALLRALGAEFSRRGVVHSAESAQFATSTGPVAAARWFVSLGDSDDEHGCQLAISLLEDAAEQLAETNDDDVTATVLPAAQRPAGRRMLVMDVDSTLIDQEVIDLLAGHAGVADEVTEVTERAMRGELDFTASLHARVSTLAGLPQAVLEQTSAAVTPSAGAEQLIAEFRQHDWPVYAVSGGFTQILAPLAERLGLTGFRANDLVLHQEALTGEVQGEIVDRAMKAEQLRQWAQREQIPAAHVVAVGDGANDLDMLAAAGTSVAFCAKPALAAAADLRINHRSMELISFALGISR